MTEVIFLSQSGTDAKQKEFIRSLETPLGLIESLERRMKWPFQQLIDHENPTFGFIEG